MAREHGSISVVEKIHRNALKPDYLLHWYQIKEILGKMATGIESNFNFRIPT